MAKFCKKCGTDLHGEVFCSECGYKVEAVEQSVPPMPAFQQSTASPSESHSTASVPAAVANNKNKTVGIAVAACLVVAAGVATFIFDPFGWRGGDDGAVAPDNIVAITPNVPNESAVQESDIRSDAPMSLLAQSIERDVILVQQALESGSIIAWFADEARDTKKQDAFEDLTLLSEKLSKDEFYFTINGSLNEYYISNNTLIEELSPVHKLDSNDFYDQWFFVSMKSEYDITLNFFYDYIADMPAVWINHKVFSRGIPTGIISTSVKLDDETVNLFNQNDSTNVLNRVLSELPNYSIGIHDIHEPMSDANASIDTNVNANANNQQTTDAVTSYTAADLVGFWQAEWTMADGSEVIVDMAFGTFGEFFMLVGYKYSEAMGHVEGDFEVSGGQIHVQGIDYVYAEPYYNTFDFRFVGDKLYIDFGPEQAFTKARTPPYNIHFNVG